MYRFGIIVMTIAVSLFVGSAVAQSPQQDAQNAAPSTPPDAATQGAAPQNSAGDAIHNMIGAWEFSNADHDKICHFNFRADTAPNGYKLDVDKNCPSLFPSTKNMVAWSVDNFGSLRLLDAGGNSVVDLSEVETGMYDGFTPEEG
ncbi:MAG: AprI/Inh family metalloprotease inhibitor, partial [Xanthobacteraceae bacterium]